MLPLKSHHGSVVKMPLKPIKRGLKLYDICDPETGYTYASMMHIGGEEEQHSEDEKAVTRVVVDLCEQAGMLDQGY